VCALHVISKVCGENVIYCYIGTNILIIFTCVENNVTNIYVSHSFREKASLQRLKVDSSVLALHKKYCHKNQCHFNINVKKKTIYISMTHCSTW